MSGVPGFSLEITDLQIGDLQIGKHVWSWQGRALVSLLLSVLTVAGVLRLLSDASALQLHLHKLLKQARVDDSPTIGQKWFEQAKLLVMLNGGSGRGGREVHGNLCVKWLESADLLGCGIRGKQASRHWDRYLGHKFCNHPD